MLEQLSLSDLQRLIRLGFADARNISLSIHWRDGSSSGFREYIELDQLTTIAQVEQISFLAGYCSFGDSSMLHFDTIRNAQAFVSTAPHENSEAQARIYKIRNEKLAGGARIDTRAEDAAETSQRLRTALQVVSASFLIASGVTSFRHGISVLYWVLLGVGLLAIIVQVPLANAARKRTYPRLDPVVLEYPPPQTRRLKIEWQDSIWVVVGGVVSVITLFITILK